MISADEWQQHLDNVLIGARSMLFLAGEDVGRSGLVKTPVRFLEAWLELTERPGDPAELLSTTFDDVGPVDEAVKVGPLAFSSVCEHHLMAFGGLAWIAYIPTAGVVGLSKLPRLLEHYARRPQVQERLTGQITEALDKHVVSLGSACSIRAVHTCASSRGVRKDAPMTTTSLTGAFRNDAAARAEFLAWVHGQ